MVSLKHKFIFIHIPKTGGNSIEEHFGAWKDPRGDSSMLVGGNKEHFPLWRILREVPSAIDYFKFTFCRNPWDKAVSEWCYMQKHPMTIKAKSAFSRYGRSFESFVKNNLISYANPKHSFAQHRLLDAGKYKSTVDFIGRFENIQEDWNLICDKLNIQRFNLPHKNKTNHKHYTEYYDEETKQIVAEKYAKDIEYFGYKFGE